MAKGMTKARQWIEDRLVQLKPRGKSKGGLAEALNIAPSAVTNIIKGTREIALREVAPLAKYLEMDRPEVEARLSGVNGKLGNTQENHDSQGQQPVGGDMETWVKEGVMHYLARVDRTTAVRICAEAISNLSNPEAEAHPAQNPPGRERR